MDQSIYMHICTEVCVKQQSQLKLSGPQQTLTAILSIRPTFPVYSKIILFKGSKITFFHVSCADF